MQKTKQCKDKIKEKTYSNKKLFFCKKKCDSISAMILITMRYLNDGFQ